MGGSKNYFFRLNNAPKPYDKCIILDTLVDVRYAVWQQQGDNGVDLNGYVQFKNKKSLAEVSKALPNAYWKFARGTFEENKVSCTKIDKRILGTKLYEIGVPMINGCMVNSAVLDKILDLDTKIINVERKLSHVVKELSHVLSLVKQKDGYIKILENEIECSNENIMKSIHLLNNVHSLERVIEK